MMLHDTLNELVASGRPMSEELMNDIMGYIFDERLKHTEELSKCINNCNKLMEKLSENK